MSGRSRLFLLKNFADSLRARRGWQRYGLACAYGALSSLAFSPADIVPVLWICFPALIFLLQGTDDSRRAFFVGWFFAFGFFTCDLYWTAISMFVDIRKFWWTVPFALFGLPAAFAIYYGIAATLARCLRLNGVAGTIAFALLWFLADYARGHLFTGFPWNIVGYVWADFLPVLQLTSVIGIYGLTLLTLVAACLPACLADKDLTRASRMAVISSFAMLGLIIMWGSWRLMEAPMTTVPNVRLRLVQPDVSQQKKWKYESLGKNFGDLLALSSEPGTAPVTHVIWPETASPFYLTLDEKRRHQAAVVTPENGALITGGLRGEPGAGDVPRYYNSLIAIDHNGDVVGVYDKAHLVPFGEYMPFEKWIPMQAIVGLGLNFSHGPGPQTLRVPGLPAFSPLICYEAIFPGHVINSRDRPQFLLNVTNDGWYGNSAGPYQHFAIARVRAVEEGMPLVRVANTGISGIVDAYGRIEAKLDLGKRGFIDGDLPTVIPALTFFARANEMPLWLIFTGLIFFVLLSRIFWRRT